MPRVAAIAATRGCTLRQVMKCDGGTDAPPRRSSRWLASNRDARPRRNSYIAMSFVKAASGNFFTTGS